MSCRNLLPLQGKDLRELWLCNYCKKLFIPLSSPGCKICSTPVKKGVETCSSCNGKNFLFLRNYSTFAYEGLVRDLIHEIKFRRRKYVAQGLGRLWGELLSNDTPKGNLVPLPMHPKKRRERGFDQAMIMAQALSISTKMPLTNILERTHDTPPQSGLHPQQRIDNVKGAFKIKSTNTCVIPGNTFILIDDIYTTGASLNECSRVLKTAGASKVYSMTLAIAVKNTDVTNSP